MSSTAYYPSCVVNMTLRFDEALHVLERAPGPAPGIDDIVRVGPPLAGQLAERPLILQRGSDNLSWVMNRVPKEATVDLSGYRQAGKWNITFDYRDFPVDPRVVRSLGVEIHLGAVPAEDFGDGMVRTTPGRGRRSILETRINGVMREDTLLVVGTADSIHSEWSGNGAWVKMEGRDLRGIFLDAPARPELLAKLDLKQAIDAVVRQIVSLHPYGRDIVVEVNADDWPGRVIPSPAAAGDLTRVNLGAFGTAPNMRPQGDPHKLSVWDIITNYCYIVGAVPYFVGKRLRVRPTRSLYDLRKRAGFDPTVPTPFRGGAMRTVTTETGVEKINIRRVVFGRDIDSLAFERKLAGVTVPQIEVVSLDTSSTERGRAKLRIARYPDSLPEQPTSNEDSDPEKVESALTTSVAPGGQQSMKQVLRIPVAGISSAERLRKLAHDLYEEIGRGEMGGKVQTKTLASLGGDNADPDLLSLRPGDPVEIVFDSRSLRSTPPVAHEATDHQRRSFDEEVDLIAGRIGDRNLARVLVAVSRGQVQELQSFFRVANLRVAWNVDNGVDIGFDFQNYLESRYNVTFERENTKPPKRTGAGGVRGR